MWLDRQKIFFFKAQQIKAYKKYALLNNSCKNSHRNDHMNRIFYKDIFRLIDRSIFVSYGTHAMKFCEF